MDTGVKKTGLRFYIRTFGCQMNVRDSEIISGLLTAESWQLTTNLGEADIIIFNTCSVRRHAEDKVWSEIGKLKKIQNSPIIGLVGCMAQAYKEKVFERSSRVDFVVGPNDIHKIPEIIKKVACQNMFVRKVWETNTRIRPEEIYHKGFYENREHAYVIISEGCSNFCSYCVVPYVRGELKNRPHNSI
ncbi:MAG: tRNA (N6-isopentenyl adenosine(37)-C2)-methylthiotransferase MiaB, partial [Candidatus Omnitrophota bacterium]